MRKYGTFTAAFVGLARCSFGCAIAGIGSGSTNFASVSALMVFGFTASDCENAGSRSISNAVVARLELWRNFRRVIPQGPGANQDNTRTQQRHVRVLAARAFAACSFASRFRLPRRGRKLDLPGLVIENKQSVLVFFVEVEHLRD